MTSAERFIQEINQIFGWLIGIAIIVLALKKMLRNGREWVLQARRQAFLPAFKHFILIGATEESLASLRPRWPGDRRALLQLFLMAAETIKGDVTTSLEKAFDELGLVDMVLARLSHRNWWIRAESAYQLGLMNNQRALGALQAALRDPHREVLLCASRALAHIQGVEAVLPILKHFEQPSRWATLEVADIFFSMGNEVVPQLMSTLNDITLEAQRLVIEILGHFRDPRMMAPLLPYLKSEDKEIRAKTLKAVGALGNSQAVPFVQACLEDGDWQVRLLACGALGQMKDPSALPVIAKRLMDPEVRVRQRAVEVLASFGFIGRLYLEGVHPYADEPLRRLMAPYKILAALWILIGSWTGLIPSAHADSVNVTATTVVAQEARPVLLAAQQLGRDIIQTLRYRRPWDTIPYPVYRFLEFYSHSVLYYYLFLNATYLILFIVSFFSIMRYLEHVYTPFTGHLLRSPMTLPISLLVPAYNESVGIVESVRSYLNVQFREFEVVVINDGSRDNTLEVLKRGFQLEPTTRANPQFLKTKTIRGLYRSPLHPHLLVIDKENGGKSDALNAGLNLARYPLFCAVDADSILEPQALLRVVRPFMTDPDVVAVGGVVRIANGNRIRNGNIQNIHLPRRLLPLFQIVEYLRAFFSGRMAWSAMECLMLISGAFGLFRKDVVLGCGGYRTDTVGEDMDLIVRMHRYLLDEKRPYRMVFIPDPICWTEAPESLGVLRNQRDRWQRGLLEVLWKHRGMCFNPKYGRIGLIAMPYYILVELIGPVIEFGGYIAVFLTVLLLPQNMQFLRLFFLTSILFGVLLSIGAVILEELAFHRYPRVRQMFVMIFVASLENFGYRQINAWWRCRGIIRGLLMKEGWGTMVRKGVSTAMVLMGVLLFPANGICDSEQTPGQLYEQGMQERREGRLDQAVQSFEKMRSLSPKSGGALEGLALVAIAQNRYADAERYLQSWTQLSPGNPYILGLQVRVYRAQSNIDALIETYQNLVHADPSDERAQERLHGLLEQWRSGVALKAKIRKSVGPEGLSGPSPQRIVYDGMSGGVDARFKVRPGLYALSRAEILQDAQRNDTRGFTYYDILEQIYSMGLEAHPNEQSRIQALYGQSFLSDIKENGVGHTEFSRFKAEGAWESDRVTSRLRLSRAPRFLRGTGSDRFFAILRQHSADGTLEASWSNWDWRLNGGVDDYSEGTTSAFGSLRARRETGPHLIQAQVSRSQQEFYGATAEGKLGLVDFTQGSVRLRRWVTDHYRIDSTYDYAAYEDHNHLHQVSAEAAGWLPFYPDLGAYYRWNYKDYGRVDDRYTSTDERAHGIGATWHRGWGRGLWSTLTYEHGFLHDDARRSYEDNTWKGELAWFIKDRYALTVSGRVNRSTLHDISHSAQLEGRVSF